MFDFIKKAKKNAASMAEAVKVDMPKELQAVEVPATVDQTAAEPAIIVPDENKVIIEETIIIRSSEDIEKEKEVFRKQWRERKMATDAYAETEYSCLPRVCVDIIKDTTPTYVDIHGAQTAKANEAYVSAAYLNGFTFNYGKFVLTDVFPKGDALELLQGIMGIMEPSHNLMVVESKLTLDPDGGKSPHVFIRIPYYWGTLTVHMARWMEALLDYTLLDCVDENGNANGTVLFDYFMAHDAPTYAYAEVQDDRYFNGDEERIHATAEYAVLTLCNAIARSAVAEVIEASRRK